MSGGEVTCLILAVLCLPVHKFIHQQHYNQREYHMADRVGQCGSTMAVRVKVSIHSSHTCMCAMLERNSLCMLLFVCKLVR